LANSVINLHHQSRPDEGVHSHGRRLGPQLQPVRSPARAWKCGAAGSKRSSASFPSGHQGIVGLCSAANLGGEPSASTDPFAGMICDSTDTNWQIYSYGGSGSGTKIDTGISRTLTGNMPALFLYAAPGSSGVQWQLENEETQAVPVGGTMTLTLPGTTTLLSATSVKARNGATTTSAEIRIAMIANGPRYG